MTTTTDTFDYAFYQKRYKDYYKMLIAEACPAMFYDEKGDKVELTFTGHKVTLEKVKV